VPDYTTNALCASILRRGGLPAGTGLSRADLLQRATEELRGSIYAFLKGLREEFVIAPLVLSPTTNTVTIPVRASGAALRTVQFQNNTTQGYFNLPRVEPERAVAYIAAGTQPQGFFFQGNNLILIGCQNPVGSLQISYQQRGGQLVFPTACGQITSITPGGSTTAIVVSSAPTTFTSSQLYDFVSATPNFVASALDVVAAVSGTTLTVANSLVPSTLAVGDYVCLAGETCIPQLPYELHDLLAQVTAQEIAMSTGSSRLDAITSKTNQLKNDLTNLLSPRTDGQARPVISRGAGWRRRGGW
jgi:hypothetical protein